MLLLFISDGEMNLLLLFDKTLTEQLFAVSPLIISNLSNVNNNL